MAQNNKIEIIKLKRKQNMQITRISLAMLKCLSVRIDFQSSTIRRKQNTKYTKSVIVGYKLFADAFWKARQPVHDFANVKKATKRIYRIGLNNRFPNAEKDQVKIGRASCRERV